MVSFKGKQKADVYGLIWIYSAGAVHGDEQRKHGAVVGNASALPFAHLKSQLRNS